MTLPSVSEMSCRATKPSRIDECAGEAEGLESFAVEENGEMTNRHRDRELAWALR